MTESSARSRLKWSERMCGKRDTLRREIDLARGLLAGLTDPSSIALVKADIELLEESLNGVIAKHHSTAK
jgi:hypothetical protein